jgi:hypothetical protein
MYIFFTFLTLLYYSLNLFEQKKDFNRIRKAFDDLNNSDATKNKEEHTQNLKNVIYLVGPLRIILSVITLLWTLYTIGTPLATISFFLLGLMAPQAVFKDLKRSFLFDKIVGILGFLVVAWVFYILQN